MNKQELEQKIASMEKELAELKSELTQQDKIWRPENGDEFWVITGEGSVFSSRYYVIDDEDYIKRCNYFQTKKEAEKQSEYDRVMNRFRKYVEAYSEPLDWNNYNQNKYCAVFDYETNCICYLINIIEKNLFQIYASSEQILKDAIIYSAGSEKEFIRIVFGVEKC